MLRQGKYAIAGKRTVYVEIHDSCKVLKRRLPQLKILITIVFKFALLSFHINDTFKIFEERKPSINDELHS